MPQNGRNRVSEDLKFQNSLGEDAPGPTYRGAAFGAPFVRTPYAENMDPCQPLFGAIMTRNSLQLLLKFLHFNNSQKPEADDPQLRQTFQVTSTARSCM